MYCYFEYCDRHESDHGYGLCMGSSKKKGSISNQLNSFLLEEDEMVSEKKVESLEIVRVYRNEIKNYRILIMKEKIVT